MSAPAPSEPTAGPARLVCRRGLLPARVRRGTGPGSVVIAGCTTWPPMAPRSHRPGADLALIIDSATVALRSATPRPTDVGLATLRLRARSPAVVELFERVWPTRSRWPSGTALEEGGDHARAHLLVLLVAAPRTSRGLPPRVSVRTVRRMVADLIPTRPPGAGSSRSTAANALAARARESH